MRGAPAVGAGVPGRRDGEGGRGEEEGEEDGAGAGGVGGRRGGRGEGRRREGDAEQQWQEGALGQQRWIRRVLEEQGSWTQVEESVIISCVMVQRYDGHYSVARIA